MTTNTLPAPLDVKLMNWTATVLFAGCAVAVLVAAGSWARHHPMFAIGRIVVQGELVHNNAVTLRANVGPHLVGNFFTMDLAAVREAFEQVPWVRRALVRREFPNGLRVELQEHDAFAYWGPEEGSTLLSTRGEVFEASADDLEDDGLPRLQGPQGQSEAVMRMYQRLAPVVEPLGAVLGASVIGLSAGLLPWGLGFAAGAMLFVISHEIIPESHRKGHESWATGGLMIGFVLMMLLDTALG